MAPLPPDATLSDAGEFGLISELVALFPQGEHVLVGPGDDAAVLRVRTGHVVVSTDLVVEGRHFRRDWATAEDVGHRAAAQNLSDINAMGGRAHSLTVGLAAPADLPAAWALDFARGFAAEAAGASVMYTTAFALGAPISTTHTITTAIMGAGATKRLFAVRWGVARSIVTAWVLTFPAAGLAAAGFYFLLHLVLPV